MFKTLLYTALIAGGLFGSEAYARCGRSFRVAAPVTPPAAAAESATASAATGRRTFSVEPGPATPSYNYTYRAPAGRGWGTHRPNNVLPDAGAKIRGEF